MKYLEDFLKHIDIEKNDSKYTSINYELDIVEYLDYCKAKQVDYAKIITIFEYAIYHS